MLISRSHRVNVGAKLRNFAASSRITHNSSVVALQRMAYNLLSALPRNLSEKRGAS
jgi:hypothetical protein